jgi:glycosyltransferase involved in cell wall biosynthesis
MSSTPTPRVVLVHDWLTGMRGGEKCLEYFCRRWPDAPLYTVLHKPNSVTPSIEWREVRTSFLQLLPAVDRYYRYLLPLMPWAVGWNLPKCDLVLSSSHCVAKGVRPPEGVPHICYCFTPMRYAWHMRTSYFGEKKSIKARLINLLLASIRRWDKKTAANVTHFVAISKTVQKRIKECYERDSVVIYPPVDTDFYCPAPVPREEFYLVVSAFAPYKRIDLCIDACNQLKRKLVIIGKGQNEAKLRAMAGPTVEFMGWQPDEVIRDSLRKCRALLFPGEEDFGIVPVEAQACGTPVIAYGRGGATETVIPPGRGEEPTGFWFGEQSAECLIQAIRQFESVGRDFSPRWIRQQAVRFHGQRFAEEIFGYVNRVLDDGAASMRRRAA